MIGQRLKELRDAKRLSQSDLAEITGIPQSTLSHYERGVEISASNLIKLAHALGCTSDYILGIEDETQPIDVSNRERLILDELRRGNKLKAIAMIASGDE